MKANNLHEHLVDAMGHLQAALVVAGVDLTDVEVTDTLDAAVAADPTFKAAHRRFSEAIQQLAAACPSPEARIAVLKVEEAVHAAIAAATDVAWRLGRSGRPGAT